MTDWWWSPEWLAYERACGREGERARVLASADWRTRVIDLRRPREALWADVRRSYHAIINRQARDGSLIVATANPEQFLAVCLPLHREAAGRLTRPLESWELQASWIRRGLGSAVLALRRQSQDEETGDVESRAVGFTYVLVYRGWAYYMSAVYREPNVGHALVWRTIDAAHHAGLRHFEMGWQGEATDDKGRQIEFFRRGFGGTDVPARLERVQ